MDYPVALKVKGKRCLVVGGGRVALRKVRGLLQCGARVGVVARDLEEELAFLVRIERINYLGPRYRSSQVEGCFLVFAATDSAALNARIYRDACRRGAPVNVADRPELCSFQVPSVLRRGPVTIGISTGGNSPALARQLRKYMENIFPPDLGKAAVFLGRIRPLVIAKHPDQRRRAVVFNRLAWVAFLSVVRTPRESSLSKEVRKNLADTEHH